MKRFLIGAGWCLVLWFGVMVIGGMVTGAVAGASAADASAGYQAGGEAGAAFGQKYGNLGLLAAMAISAIGTITGWLPGTRDVTRSESA